MKNRKCPYKGSLCLDYGSCESCEWGKLINRYEKRIKRLKTKIATLEASNDYLKRRLSEEKHEMLDPELMRGQRALLCVL